MTRLSLSPGAFWALSPREWGWLADALAPAPGLAGADLAALIEQYPDDMP